MNALENLGPGRKSTKHLPRAATSAVAAWLVMIEISPNTSPSPRRPMESPAGHDIGRPRQQHEDARRFDAFLDHAQPLVDLEELKARRQADVLSSVKGAKIGLVWASVAINRSRRKRKSTLSSSGEAATKSLSSGRSMAST